MGRVDKIERAQKYLARNDEIITLIEKLCNEYNHNQNSAENLYKKAQVDIWELPDIIKYGSILNYTF